jgi:hypothetical protein
MNARALTHDFPPVISRLIPRLASPHDGEVVATARAIERTLKAQKLDWHDVAAALTAPAPPTQWDYEPSRTESQESSEIRSWLEAVAQEDWPNDWTAGFIDNLLRRPSLDRLSKKQLAVVNNIVSEAYRRGVRVDRRAA